MGAPTRAPVAGINVLVAAGSHTDTLSNARERRRVSFQLFGSCESGINHPALFFLGLFRCLDVIKLHKPQAKPASRCNRTGTVSKGMDLDLIDTGCLLEVEHRKKELPGNGLITHR